MDGNEILVLLADDDNDDCLLFQEALEELPLSTHLTIVHDGEQLMELLKKKINRLPHVLFMDLNMPRKNGFECLTEIKLNIKMQQLCVIISSTSSKKEIVNLVYENGAQYYICKPPEFSKLKKIIQEALTIILENLLVGNGPDGIWKGSLEQTPKENFVLTGDLKIIET